MAIALSWYQNDTGTDFTVSVYRSTSSFTKDTLPAQPVAVLSNGETYWNDKTSIYGVTYYYMLKRESADGVIYSGIKSASERIESPWGVNAPDTLVYGGDTRFGQASDVNSGDVYGDFVEYIYNRLGATFDKGAPIHRFVIGGRYYLIPSKPVSAHYKKLIAENCVLGHRTPRLPAGADPDVLGKREIKNHFGRGWSVGLPNFSETIAASDFTGNVRNSEITDERGRITIDEQLKYPACVLLWQTATTTTAPSFELNGNKKRSSFTPGWISTCDTLPTGDAVNPSIVCMYSTVADYITYTTRQVSAGSGPHYLFIEYKGLI